MEGFCFPSACISGLGNSLAQIVFSMDEEELEPEPPLPLPPPPPLLLLFPPRSENDFVLEKIPLNLNLEPGLDLYVNDCLLKEVFEGLRVIVCILLVALAKLC